MGSKIRTRCPICGMLVWQSRLNKDFKFEFVIQESSGKGYQQIEHKYKPAYMADTDPAKMFQVVLAFKMVEKAEELLKEIYSNIKVDLQMPKEIGKEFIESYEEVTKEKHEVEHEIDHKVAQPVYVSEFKVDGHEYEIELPTLQAQDVKKQSFFKKLRRSKRIEEMEAIGELEINHDVKDVGYEIESLLRR